jgi:predicted pyridoxine 5'-phosphate oxidase superfamily flavin-nucleotide-binding protein
MPKITPKIRKVIEENPLAFATLDSKNSPYIIGVAFCKVKNNQIVITDNFMKSTTDNVKRRRKVALLVWDKKWNGYQFLGEGKYYSTGIWSRFVKSLKENRGLLAKGAIVIKVNKIIKSK